MKHYQITIDEERKEWLIKTLGQIVEISSRDASRFVGYGVVAAEVQQIVKDAQEIKQTRQKRPEPQEQFLPNLCKEHPTYTAQKPPRIDCEGHWEAYKKMNPMEYKAARQRYIRAKKKKEKGNG